MAGAADKNPGRRSAPQLAKGDFHSPSGDLFENVRLGDRETRPREGRRGDFSMKLRRDHLENSAERNRSRVTSGADGRGLAARRRGGSLKEGWLFRRRKWRRRRFLPLRGRPLEQFGNSAKHARPCKHIICHLLEQSANSRPPSKIRRRSRPTGRIPTSDS